MVMSGKTFWKDRKGTALVEGLLVFPLVLLAFASLIEFGFAVYQWNQTAKALQLGARLLAVSAPLAVDMTPLVSDYPSEEGAAPPDTAVAVSCGAGTTACTATEINRLIFGTDNICNPNFGATKPGMCDFNGRIQPANVLITYARSGLGYVGRPGGPVVTITLELRGLTFDFFFLGALLGLDSFEIPAFPVTITGEDMNSCQDECT
jgi:TadE-like protein